jgi:hypothetical protein
MNVGDHLPKKLVATVLNIDQRKIVSKLTFKIFFQILNYGLKFRITIKTLG